MVITALKTRSFPTPDYCFSQIKRTFFITREPIQLDNICCAARKSADNKKIGSRDDISRQIGNTSYDCRIINTDRRISELVVNSRSIFFSNHRRNFAVWRHKGSLHWRDSAIFCENYGNVIIMYSRKILYKNGTI